MLIGKTLPPGNVSFALAVRLCGAEIVCAIEVGAFDLLLDLSRRHKLDGVIAAPGSQGAPAERKTTMRRLLELRSTATWSEQVQISPSPSK
jgi:hypothetical protein